jgi:hypothetical protein
MTRITATKMTAATGERTFHSRLRRATCAAFSAASVRCAAERFCPAVGPADLLGPAFGIRCFPLLVTTPHASRSAFASHRHNAPAG